MNIFKGLLTGALAITHSCIIHRDLKPANILLGPNNTPKIIDFGFCEVIMGGGILRAFNVGSPAYMAPEALNKTLYSEKSDGWSLGIILYEMLHGNTPDGGRNIK
jgi:serine/threonine protein kinase